MRLRIPAFVLFVALACSIVAAAPSSQTPEPKPMGTKVSRFNNPYKLPTKLFDLWNSLTLEEKIGQMIMVYMAPPNFTVENNLTRGRFLHPVNATKESRLPRTRWPQYHDTLTLLEFKVNSIQYLILAKSFV